MAALDFPASPSLNDTATLNGIEYVYDGQAWVPRSEVDIGYSDANPQGLGASAAPGTAEAASRADHVHAKPTTGDVVGTTDTQTLTNKTLTQSTETQHSETTSGNITLDLADGMVQSITLDAAREITMPAAPSSGESSSFVLELYCQTYTPTWGTSPAILWDGGAAPTLETTTGKLNELTFRYSHLASKWVGRLTFKEVV